MNKYNIRQACQSKLTIAVGLAIGASAAQAATFNVTSTADAGPGTLRQAIIDANGAAGADTIDLSAVSGSTITLASDLDTISDEVEIVGADATLDGAGNACFYAYGADLSISNLTVTDCSGTYYDGFYRGGAIYSYGGELSISESTITGNNADLGGGIMATGAAYFSMEGTTVSGNSATSDAGGILVAGRSSDIIDSTISGNTSTNVFGGGYLYADYGAAGDTVNISGSTISGNSSGLGGGLVIAAYTYDAAYSDGIVRVENSTVSGNTSESFSGLYIRNDGFSGKYGNLDPEINASTITGNQATVGAGAGFMMANYGASYYGYSAEPLVENSIIQGNTAVLGSGDLDSDAAAPPVGRVINTFRQNIIDNPEPFTRAFASQVTAKTGVENPTPQQISDFFSAKINSDARGAPNNVTFNVNTSIIGVAPTAAGFNPDVATNGALGSDPLLGPLADNGGPTLTHLPGAGSIAIDFIPDGTNGCGTTLVTDQRGEPRPFGPACDAGSVEGSGTVLPESVPVPTLNHWATGILAFGLAIMGWLSFRRRSAVKQE